MDGPLGWVPEPADGWREIETNIDRHEGYVRVTVSEVSTNRTIYSAKYTPEMARTMARVLTMNAYKIEDENA